jgi:hypothetical protein
MLTRLTHAGIAFALTVALYQGYLLAVAPFVEPAGAVGQVVQEIPPEKLKQPPASVKQYESLLRAYFAPTHWSLQETPPKIIDNGQTMIVFDDRIEEPGGRMTIPHMAVVFFPGVRDRGAEPPRDAIILEPAGGATMQMDQEAGKRFGSIGRMQYGNLLGQVIIRSDMKEPGPQDDLFIEAKDLYMNQDFIRTPEAVTMSLGKHKGRGRGMVLRFFKTKSASSSGPTTLFGKLESLEISDEVAALIVPGATTILGTPTASQAPEARAGGKDQLAAKFSDAPAEINCTGPFQIDFNIWTATFNDNVHLSQRHPDGTFDELIAPRSLTLYFDQTHEWGGDAPQPAPSSVLGSTKFEPASVEARGLAGAPVTLRALSQGAAATGDRLFIELRARQVTLEAEKEASLEYRGAEIHAPVMRYELPPKDSNRRLGMMYAKGGLGWLRTAPDLKRPNELLEVRWTQSMQMVRRGGQPVLILDGRPKVTMAGIGELLADQLELTLRETPETTAPTVGQGNLVPPAIEAERIIASGSVDIESAELSDCNVDKLDLRILRPQTAGSPAPVVVNAATPGPAPPSSQPSLFDRRPGRAGGRTYTISGRTLEIDAVTRDRHPQVSAIRVDGNVVFKESSPANVGEAPLRILAEHLNVTDAETPEAKIEIRGNDGAAGAPGSLAEISARGTILRAPTLLVNRGTSQAWINSPGEVQMLMTRDATGKPLSQPQPLAVTWRDAMELNRDRITFTGNVHVQHPDGWLRTRRLAVVLTAPVQFDGATSNKPPELAQLECWEGAIAEFEQRDPLGALTSRQHIEINSLVVNQITGAIRGEGPGLIDSVHLSKGQGSWFIDPDGVSKNKDNGQIAMPAPVQLDVSMEAPQLRHLHIDFVRGVDGNVHTPQVRVFGDVQTIYGPVSTWDDRLQKTPGGSPGPDELWLECDSLQVTDSPLARLQTPSINGERRAFGQVELTTEGNVIIEGIHPQHGAFTINGHRAAFDQAKSMLVLEGNEMKRATITRQPSPGAPFQTQSAGTFIYWQNTGKVKVLDFDQVNMNQFGNP